MRNLSFSLLLTTLALSSCVQTPFVDSRREAGFTSSVGESTLDRVAVCYNSYSTNANEILRMAQEVCEQTNREPAYDGHDFWSCRLFLPHRVFYRCQEKPVEEIKEAEEKDASSQDIHSTESQEGLEVLLP